MKKTLFFMMMAFAIVFAFSACSGGDDGDDSSKNTFSFLEFNVTSDAVVRPEGNVYIFYKQDGDTVIKGKPLLAWWLDGSVSPPYYHYENSFGEDCTIFPISKYASIHDGELHKSGNKPYSYNVFFNDDLSVKNADGTLKSGKYMIVITSDDYPLETVVYKEFTITKNSIITVKIPSHPNGDEYVDAEWNISDYKEK
ncbi:MAG: hypothetical protein LKF81_10235 [Prevotella sp.]|jgi:hypothetical protein|nr:hypothetical protein [Prevotella sp.]